MQDIFAQFSFTINKLNKLMQRVRAIEMHQYGLKTVHVMCLYYLNAHPEGLTATELVHRTLEDKAAISRAVLVLRKQGYVTCAEGRKRPICLTEEGKRFAEYVAERAACAVERCQLDLSEEERTFFFRCLYSISDRLQIYYEKLIERFGRQEDEND